LRIRSNDPRVGITVFVGAAIVVFGALYAFARYPSVFRHGREYRSAFHNVAGLNLGDEVRYGGLAVGTVTSMDLDKDDPTRIEVRFKVKRRTPVRVDTRATITQVGFLGKQYLNLTPGTPTAASLPEGSTIPSEDNLSFQDAMTQLARFFERTDTLLNVATRLSKSNPLQRIDQLLTRVDQMVATTGESSGKLMVQLDEATRQLSQVLAHTDRVLTAVDTSLRTAGPGISTTQREALATLRETRVLVSDLRDAMQESGGVDQLMRNLAIATDNLARLSTRVERDPTSVLSSRKLPAKKSGPAVRE
jgi:phospholipid/cholesterol/gamma-HCH transport system substrate-binding protein